MDPIRNKAIRIHQIQRSRVAAGFVAVELAEHVEGGHESDEAEAHHEHHRRRYLQPRRVVRVETEHVACAAASHAAGAVSSAGAATHATAAHAGGCGGRAAGSHDSRPRCAGGGCGLRLRGASGHVDGDCRKRGKERGVLEWKVKRGKRGKW